MSIFLWEKAVMDHPLIEPLRASEMLLTGTLEALKE